MRSQTAVLVLCALVFSTFGHELLNHGKTAQHSKKSKKLVANSKSSAPASRDHTNSPTQDGRLNLQILVNPATNLLAFLNATIELGIIFDPNADYVGVFWGSTGDVIVINLETKVGTFSKGNPQLHSWNSRSESFPTYFKSVRCLRDLFEYGLRSGEKCHPDNVSEEIALGLQLTINLVSRGEYASTRSRSLHRTIFLSRAIVATLKGPLKGVLNILGDGVFTVGISSRSVIVRLQTLGEIVARIGAGVDILPKIGFDWNAFFFEPSGIELFINIFSKLVAHNVDCRPIIREYSREFKILLSSLGGNSTRGPNGVIKLVGEFKSLIDGTTPINEVVPILVEYFRNTASYTPNLQEFRKQSQDILIFLQKSGLASEVSVSVAFFNAISQNNPYVYKGVDANKILTNLFQIRVAPLSNIVRILAEIRQVVKIETSLGLLFYYLTELTVDGSINDVRAVAPGVTIDESYNVLVFIFRGAKLSSLQRNLYKFLWGRPVFSRILSIIDSSFVPSDRVTLQGIFQSPGFARFGRAITRVLARAICAVNGGQVNHKTVIPTGMQRHHKRIHHGTRSAAHIKKGGKKHHNQENNRSKPNHGAQHYNRKKHQDKSGKHARRHQ